MKFAEMKKKVQKLKMYKNNKIMKVSSLKPW